MRVLVREYSCDCGPTLIGIPKVFSKKLLPQVHCWHPAASNRICIRSILVIINTEVRGDEESKLEYLGFLSQSHIQGRKACGLPVLSARPDGTKRDAID